MLSHYLMFNRNCAEALDLYARAFDAKIIERQTYGDMPPNPAFPIAEADKSLVLHAKIVIDGAEIMCADVSERSMAGDNMYVCVTTPDESCVRRAWDVLANDGEVYMELAPSFFAAAHGSLQDKFGVNWMFTVTR
ncbi:MAG: VOC family protein [Oscillospiraceae bacterium]|jgi:PhnB protein|nr:VOC family protein [Oscillospiraceae bacterium]